MDPITIGLLVAMGAGGAAAVARWRRRRALAKRPAARAKAESTEGGGALHVGEVLLHVGEEYWLAGELTLVREGSAALRVFSAPSPGTDRWVAAPRTEDSIYVMTANDKLAAVGWPGLEVPVAGTVLRRVEEGACAIAPSGEVDPHWEGVGRYAVFRALENVAVVVEQGGRRLALAGKVVPRRLIERMG